MTTNQMKPRNMTVLSSRDQLWIGAERTLDLESIAFDLGRDHIWTRDHNLAESDNHDTDRVLAGIPKTLDEYYYPNPEEDDYLQHRLNEAITYLRYGIRKGYFEEAQFEGMSEQELVDFVERAMNEADARADQEAHDE